MGFLMSIGKNYIYNTTVQVLNILVPFITVPYITRILGSEGIGIVSFAKSITTYFVLFGTLGIAIYGNRTIAYVKNDPNKRSEVFWEIFFSKCITAGISFSVYLIMVVYCNIEYPKVYFVYSLLILSALIDISWFFMGMENFRSILFRGLIIRCFTLCLVFVLIKEPNDYPLYAFIITGGTFLGNLALWFRVNKYINWKKIKIKNVLFHIKGLFILLIPSLAREVYAVLDKTMVGVFSTNTEVGLYTVSDRLVRTAYTIVTSMGAVMLPRISTLFTSSNFSEINKYAKKSFQFATYASFLIFAMIFSLMPEFVPFYFGEGFSKTIMLIRLMSPIILFVSLSNVAAIQFIIPLKREKYFTYSVITGALVNFPLNLVLIPVFGSVGAAIGTLAAELTTTLMLLYFLNRLLCMKNYFYDLWKNVLSVAFCIFIVRITSLLGLHILILLIFEVILGIISYLTVQYILKNKINSMILNKIFNYINKIIK